MEPQSEKFTISFDPEDGDNGEPTGRVLKKEDPQKIAEENTQFSPPSEGDFGDLK